MRIGLHAGSCVKPVCHNSEMLLLFQVLHFNYLLVVEGLIINR